MSDTPALPAAAAPVWTSRFADIKPFVAALECLNALRPDVVLTVDRAGIHATAIDAQHVILMHLYMSAADLAAHAVVPGGDVSFVADLKSLVGILKLAVKRGETIISRFANRDNLSVEFLDSTFQVQPKRGFVSGSDIEVPNLQYEACVTMSTKEAKRVFKELTAIGGDLVLTYDDRRKQLSIACDGPSGSAKMVLAEGSSGIAGVEGSKPIRPQRYDAKMFNKIVCQKADTGGKEVSIRIVEGFPIEVRHRVGESGHVRFFLAPKTNS